MDKFQSDGSENSDTDARVVEVLQRAVEGILDLSEAEKLISGLSGKSESDRSLVFMFAGVGDHYVNMARELYEAEPVFRRNIDLGFERLQAQHRIELKSVLYPANQTPAKKLNGGAKPALDLRKMLNRGGGGRNKDSDTDPLHQIHYSHPAVFLVEYALARCLMAKGWQPQAMIGDSLGEYVAACIAGVLPLEAAIDLVVQRAKLIQTLPPGAMSAVALSEAELRSLLGEDCYIALKSTSDLCVVSGSETAISALENRLQAEAVAYRRVDNPYPLHCELMAPVGERLLQLLDTVPLKRPQIPYLSNVTGTWITDEEATAPDYWRRHTCQTVQLSQGFDELLTTPGRLFVEIGPGGSLGSFVQLHRQNVEDYTDRITYQTIAGKHEGGSTLALFQETLAQIELKISPKSIGPQAGTIPDRNLTELDC